MKRRLPWDNAREDHPTPLGLWDDTAAARIKLQRLYPSIEVFLTRGRADPARSAHFENLAARLTHMAVRSRGECRVLPWLHSLSGDTALAFLIRADRAGSALP